MTRKYTSTEAQNQFQFSADDVEYSCYFFVLSHHLLGLVEKYIPSLFADPPTPIVLNGIKIICRFCQYYLIQSCTRVNVQYCSITGTWYVLLLVFNSIVYASKCTTYSTVAPVPTCSY